MVDTLWIFIFYKNLSHLITFNHHYFILSPPDGCLQYHTGIDGKFETFNFPGTTTVQHLPNQDYSVCIRQEEGTKT